MLKSDVARYDSGTYRELELLVWKTDDGTPPSYYVIESGGIDRTTTDFVVRKFTVRPRGGKALIDVVWRRVGSTQWHELLELSAVGTGDRTRILKST